MISFLHFTVRRQSPDGHTKGQKRTSKNDPTKIVNIFRDALQAYIPMNPIWKHEDNN